MRLPNVDAIDEAIKQLVETNHYVKNAAGEPLVFDSLPDVDDPEGDEDSE